MSVYLTQEGYKKFEKELKHLKTKRRRDISAEIAKARAHGDLKENAEYHAAREAQSHNEARIKYLESNLAGAKIIEKENIADDKVYIGATVTLYDIDADKEVKYKLVSELEADIEQNKISVESPVGRHLIGKEEGDEVQIVAPGRELNYEVVSIER